MPSEKKPLIALIGPTAVGKTELSLQLAEQLNAEIVSSDSRLFYRGMDIGTAKPTRDERARVPHHLIDVSDPDDTWSLTRFQQAAFAAIDEIHARGRLPLLVGGTGQYVRAIVDGWQPPSVHPHPRLRQILEKWEQEEGTARLHQALQRLDPAAGAAIDPRNVRRVIRALEVIFTTGRPFSSQRRKGEPPYRVLMIGLTRPRPELYARVDARIEAMFAAGLLDEVRSLLEAGYSPDLPSMSSIGYRECAAVLQGQMTVDEAKARMRKLTRVFVRRQANWFRADDPAIRWFQAGDPQALEKILAEIRSFLKNCP